MHWTPPLSDLRRASLGPATIAALERMGAPRMPETIRFAILTAPGQRPIAFETLDALARNLNAKRRGRAIECAQRPMCLPDEPRTRVFVTVYALGLDGGREETIGIAWVGEGRHPRDRLALALERVQPQTFGQSEAA